MDSIISMNRTAVQKVISLEEVEASYRKQKGLPLPRKVIPRAEPVRKASNADIEAGPTLESVYGQLRAGAAEIQNPGESFTAAWERFTTTTQRGRELLIEYSRLKLGQPSPFRYTTPIGPGPEAIGSSSAYSQMKRLAKGLRQFEPSLSEAQAFAKIYEDPKNASLRAAYRKQNPINNG